MAGPNGDRSIASLLGDIVTNLQQMVRAEVRLAKVELRQEAAKARQGAVLLVAGGLAAVLGLGVLLLAAVYALALVVPAWAAALIVGLVTAAVGGAVVSAGLRHFHSIHLPPQKSAAVLAENIQWAKQRTR